MIRQAFPVVLALASLGCATTPDSAPPRPVVAPQGAPATGALAQLRDDAARLKPLVGSASIQRFLAATSALPSVAPRKLWHDRTKKHFYDAAQVAALAPTARAELVELVVDEELYYNTKYGSPLSYARALDLLAGAGTEPRPGLRVLDFGYGYVGHLRLLASLGVDATGLDVDPLLPAIYSRPQDQGAIAGFGGAPGGRVRLLSGRFPADSATTSTIGARYDLFVSKNVLKKGYIHPDRPADEKYLIQLGVSDEAFLGAIQALLVPGGRAMIYNVCPALSPPDKPFVPWSDGRSPFSRAQWEAAGFRVLEIDHDDTAEFRAFGRALGWDKGEEPMDLENDLSVIYTLVEKPKQ